MKAIPHHEKLAVLQEGIQCSIKSRRTFHFVADAENRGALCLYGGYFDIATSTLVVLNHSRGEFLPYKVE